MDIAVFSIVLGSAFLHALWNFAAKEVSGNLNVIWLSLCLATLLSFPVAWFVGMPRGVSGETWMLVIVSGFILALYYFLLGKAYSFGDISTVYPIARGLGVMGTAVFAIFFMREDISFSGMTGICAITLGIVFVGMTRNKIRTDQKALLYATLVGCTIIAYSLLGKIIVNNLHPFTYGFLLQFLEMAFLIPVVFCTDRKQKLKPDWKRFRKEVWIIGVGSPAVYLLILFTFRLAPASYVVAVRETSVAFGALLGFVILQEKFTLRKGLGIAAIVLGIVLIQVA